MFFSAALFTFLDELESNNDRDWFKANKDRYERDVRSPALELIRAMQPRLAKIAPDYVADDRKQGGSLMRIHRDVRFSKDKSPYKTNVGIQFRHFRGKDAHAPGFYLHIQTSGCFLGVGSWHPAREALASVRSFIDSNGDDWLAGLEAATKGRFDQSGDSLIRCPRGYPKDHPLLDQLLFKDHCLIRDFEIDEALDPDLDEILEEAFSEVEPFVSVLSRAIGLVSS